VSIDKKWLVYKIKNSLRLKKMADFLSNNGKWLQVSLANNAKMREDTDVLDLNDKHPLVNIHADLCNLKGTVKANTYDYIICNAVLEHVKQPWKAVSELQRILKKGGSIWVEVPFTWVYHVTAYVSDENGEQNEDFVEHDYWRWTHDGLSEMFDKCEVNDYFYATPVDAQSEDYMGLCMKLTKR